jgi:hypothetical protein
LLYISCRLALADEGVPTSVRDVYLRGVPIEIDLLVPKVGAVPELGLVYEPDQVAIALEVKAGGIFGQSALEHTQTCLRTISASCPSLKCAYVTLTERRGYKWAGTTELLGAPAFTLFSYSGSGAQMAFASTGDWDSFISFVKSTVVVSV